ncbi:MAG: hypothetical protein LBQ57_10615 [Spirochaetales bacterium]|nr:hypothetical protein [Spirochaetales bacterium]
MNPLLHETGVCAGREKKEYNDLFFLCSLIEYTARKTKNHRDRVVRALGKDRLRHIYDLADVYHCENIDKVSDELIEKYRIPIGNFDNVADCRYAIPTHWDIGKVYKRLIVAVCENQGKDPIDSLTEVYCSWISLKIENYNSSAYYESPGYLYASYIAGTML